MMKKSSLFFSISLVSLILAVPCLVSALPIVCVPTGGNTAEEAALQSSLTAMGYTLRITNAPSASDCTVYVSHPGQGVGGSGPLGLLPWVQAGNSVVQISDWGPGLMPASWTSVSEGSPQTIEIVDASHPITAGLPPSWLGRGFWAYGYFSGDFIGRATSAGDPNIVRAGGYDKALSARAEGSGRLVLIGWNVYGPSATTEDLTVLQQAINWAGEAGTCTLPPANMVSWWPGNNNALDIVGTNHGVLINGATYATGKVGEAFSFDGVDDYVQAPDSASLDITSQITLDAWIYPVALGGRVVDKISVGGADGFLIDTYTGKVRLIAAGSAWVESSTILSTGTWTHIAGTYDGSVVKVYVNGLLDGSAAGTAAIPTNNLPLRIGADQNGGSVFNGLIDEVEIFNRALSASEIAAISNAGSAGKCRNPILTVNIDLPGGGTVKGGGINCPAGECSGEYTPGTKVILTATAKNSYKFRGWTGCDNPLKNICTMRMTESKEVTANFTGIYNISGKVMDQKGLPMTNVTVTLESVAGGGGGGVFDVAGFEAMAADISRLVVTDAYGKYKFTQLPNGTYKVTPGNIGFTFTPLSQRVPISDANQGGVNFRLVY